MRANESPSRNVTAHRSLRVIVAACALLAAAPSKAQTYEILHAFRNGPANPRAPLIQATDGNFYGTTSDDSVDSSGAIFRITPTGTFTPIYFFSGYDGAKPNGLVEGSDGNFYGTTAQGGVNGYGTVFRITPTGNLTTLYFFSGPDGFGPAAGVVQGSDGNFYGTTWRGGANGKGTVFRITPSGALTSLHSFSGVDGINPAGGLIQASDGNFYGTTAGAYPGSESTAFRITPSGALTNLCSFPSVSPYAAEPSGLVQGSDGDFYGTTQRGGGDGLGTVFKVTSTGTLTTLYSFYLGGPILPAAGLVQGGDGNFYGTTYDGGADFSGTVFTITPSGSLTTLHSFSGGDGSAPRAALARGIDGSFYGTTSYEGTGFVGTVFNITSSGTLTTLYSFVRGDGSLPVSGLVQASDGNLYGSTYIGGGDGFGTVFQVTPTGTFTTIHSFIGTDGAGPNAGLVLGSDGDLYGMTRNGGVTGLGTIFKITLTGTLTTLHSFLGADGADPDSSLVQGADGSFYGTTYDGGANNFGTVFRITPTATFTTLYSFSGTDGQWPRAGLVLGTDGNFYGTTSNGGPGARGTVFKVTPAGALTTLYSFSGSDGAFPSVALIQATDGNFYGTTEGSLYGPASTVFKITPSGTVTTLNTFPGGFGAWAIPSGLVQASDGNFYGTTYYTGSYLLGSVFSITPSGIFSTLYSFSGNEGSRPLAGVIQGTDGDFYGTTSSGGPGDAGVVFRLNPSGPATPTAVVSGDATVCFGDSTSIQEVLTGTPPWSLTWSDGFSQTGITTSPASRTVSPASSMVFYVTAVSDANGPGLSSGSATVVVTPLLSSVVVSPSGSPTSCITPYSQVSVADLGGGSVSHQWGYRTVSGGEITAIPSQIGSTYYVQNSDFPGPGTYHLVVTTTPTCGSPMVSNEVTVTISSPPTPIVVAPAVVGANSPNRTANVAAHAGSTYIWNMTNGSISSGWGTNLITFTAGTAGVPLTISVTEIDFSGCSSSPGSATVTVAPDGSAVLFYTVPPCRQLDTRFSAPIAPGGTLTVPLTGAPCGIPSGATSVSANLTVTEPTMPGYLTVYPADSAQPLASTANFAAGQTRANNAILRLATDGSGAVKVFNGSAGTVHVIIDVNGYFQ